MRKKWLIAISIGLCLTILFGNFGSFAAECNDIRQSVLRLHILANSDSDADQALKLQVRDAILAETQSLFAVQDKAAAKAAANAHLAEIEQIAARVIKDAGYAYPVKAEVVNMFFETRRYGEITMPAGRYDALRITIGNADGHNWWCVMYPPICLPAATPRQTLSDVLTEQQADIVENEPKYEVKFKVVEWFETIKEALFGD